ncbi:MAG: hypothetical protein N3G21_13065, partial [Candidatus Hydrogenedentes bacterium]|nr:hypothetical protein [Candidatus Hydrogenedentota bacterium]
KYLWKKIREIYNMDFSEIYPGAGKRNKNKTTDSPETQQQFVPIDVWVKQLKNPSQESSEP